jgi:DNA-directed RNA polymerase specialized sigma24 family protein
VKRIMMLPPGPSADPLSRMMYDIVQLPEDERLVVSLFYHENLSLDGIAVVLNVPEDEVAALFYWGHARLGLCAMPELVGAC